MPPLTLVCWSVSLLVFAIEKMLKLGAYFARLIVLPLPRMVMALRISGSLVGNLKLVSGGTNVLLTVVSVCGLAFANNGVPAAALLVVSSGVGVIICSDKGSDQGTRPPALIVAGQVAAPGRVPRAAQSLPKSASIGV